MSGEAGAGGLSKYCHIYYSSGMTVSVATPPGEENLANYVSDYFKKANIPFQEKLNKVLPELDKDFEMWISKYNLPIVPFNEESPYIERLIIEDIDQDRRNLHLEKEAKDRLINSKSGSANLHFVFTTLSFQKITLTLTLNDTIKRSELTALKLEILDLFK